LPAGARVLTDSRDFHLGGEKLGIGSSAAVCTSVYGACCKLLGRSPNYAEALAIHNGFQGKSGSGIDVAAALHGGLLRFEEQQATPWELPAELQLRFIWTGVPASTTSHVGRFNAWREEAWRASTEGQPGALAPLTDLASISKALFEQPSLATLARYTVTLKALDAAATLGIYGAGHSQLDHLANNTQVVYKPCGAGGGDIGVAVGNNAAGLDQFVAAATDLGFNSIPLEMATNGLQVAG
ncbi:MAG: hypothetical protein OES38_08125, partial [Gammaproteobacteria bacterium]|nr:hypothetical protein [Gammaproteobacteria bacterium]